MRVGWPLINGLLNLSFLPESEYQAVFAAFIARPRFSSRDSGYYGHSQLSCWQSVYVVWCAASRRVGERCQTHSSCARTQVELRW